MSVLNLQKIWRKWCFRSDRNITYRRFSFKKYVWSSWPPQFQPGQLSEQLTVLEWWQWHFELQFCDECDGFCPWPVRIPWPLSSVTISTDIWTWRPLGPAGICHHYTRDDIRLCYTGPVYTTLCYSAQQCGYKRVWTIMLPDLECTEERLISGKGLYKSESAYWCGLC